VKWDEEGVEPDEFTLVKDGVLIDYQTTREQAAWLAPWYNKQSLPVRSHGCAAVESAMSIPMQHIPNLTMKPGAVDASFADLVAGTTRGIAFIGGEARTDFQARNGTGWGLAREINNGKLGPILTDVAYLFRTTEMWKNVTAIGGVNSSQRLAVSHAKGQPSQTTSHTVTAVPMAVKNMSIINPSRRA
jgi:TldD protein